MIIKAQKESFARRLRHLLESQIELINVLEMDDMGYEEGKKGKNEKPSAGERREREGENTAAFQRRKIDIPVRRNSAGQKAGASPEEPQSKPQGEAREDGAAKEDGGPRKTPKISDQFIT